MIYTVIVRKLGRVHEYSLTRVDVQGVVNHDNEVEVYTEIRKLVSPEYEIVASMIGQVYVKMW